MEAVYLRRRLTALGVLLGLLVVAVAVIDGDEPRGGQAASEKRPSGDGGGLNVREQAGEVLLMRFNGTSMPDYVGRVLRERRASGAILFTQNATSPAQLRNLTKQLQDAAGNRALVAVDQEGGVARRLRWASETGQPALTTPEAAAEASRATAEALRAAGVNLNFAPVVDVSSGPGSAVEPRAYPGEAEAVAALGAAGVRAYRGTRVAPTVKHFPGFGRATENTDDAQVTIEATREELAADLAPFRAAVDAGTPAVMVSHALYPAYDGAWIASQSRGIVTGLLRDQLGFRGVVATDSMEAEAVVSRADISEAAVRAIYAGCDLLVLTGRSSHLPVHERLVEEAGRSPDFRRRLAESAARVLELKRSLGLRGASRR